ncbi:hypothetical protein FRC15_004559 [Serendipita sp. 397]|nr:hypothetical protein FRC15_004559 [Serendipita sp. 397]
MKHEYTIQPTTIPNIASWSRPSYASQTDEDIGNSDGNRQHDEHKTRKPITVPFCETRVAESRKLAWDDGVVQFGRDSEGVWVVLNPPRQPLRLSYERGGVTFEEQRIKAEEKLVKEQELPSTPPSMTGAKETSEESRKEKKGLESTNKGNELRPETMGGSAIAEEEAMKAVATSTESNLLHTSVVKSLNSGENELSGVPIVPTVTEPENKDTTPAAMYTRSIGEQKMPEAPLSVPKASSTSTSINFEPLCFAIRQVGGSKGQAVISLLSPPSNWKQESRFARKWKNYIVAAVEAGVVSQGKINSKPSLKIRVDPSATSEAVKQVPAPIVPTNTINYFPLHYAIWRMCDLGGRALASRIESGMADGWKTGSGFDGTLNEYIDSAVDAGSVARDGYGSDVRLKVISSKITKSDTSASALSLSPVPPPPLATAPPPPPASTSAPAPLPASITPVKGISYLPLHAAIWKTCDGSGRASISRIKPRMVNSWNVRSGFGGSLEEYIEMAVDARAVVRGGQGTEVWLMTYTGETENDRSMSTSTSTVSPVLPRAPPPVSNKGLSPPTPEPIKSGVPVVPTAAEPENQVTTPVAVLARSTGGQEKLEASVPVPAAPSTSTSINFEPLRGAIRTVCDGEGRALISQLVPPSYWRRESGFQAKWGGYIKVAVEAGVVVRGEINSEPYLKIRADEAESAETFASSPSAPPRAAQPVPVPVPVPIPVPVPAARPHPVPNAPEKVVSYLPLHAAIWRTCDVRGRALVSRIGSGMADGWKTGSGFGGTLEEYIEAAIDAKKAVRGGRGCEAWLKIYTGVPENEVSI